MSVLRYALLAQLAHGEATGYELSRRMRRPVSAFWPATHGRIYPELAALEADGLVTHTAAPGRGPRPNKTYALTDAGRGELRRWLGDAPAPNPERDEFCLKVYAGAAGDAAQLRDLAHHERARHAETLARYEATPLYTAVPRPGEPAFYAQAVLMMGVSYERHRIAWCDWFLARLEAAESAE